MALVMSVSVIDFVVCDKGELSLLLRLEKTKTHLEGHPVQEMAHT